MTSNLRLVRIFHALCGTELVLKQAMRNGFAYHGSPLEIFVGACQLRNKREYEKL